MALVGDVIITARESSPDLPQTISAPLTVPVLAATTGGSFPNGTFYIIYTWLNNWGESVGSAEANVVLAGANNAVNVTPPAGVPTGLANKVRVYYSGVASGAQNLYEEFTFAVGGTYKITNNATAISTPPNRNTAYLPDTDGSFCSVSTMYRWLNEGLKMFARITGGIQDQTAFPTLTGQNIYALTGQWLKFTHAWFDGWPIGLGGAQDTFQRTRVQGITNTVIPFKQNDVQYVELWPIPNRSISATTTTGSITSSSTSVDLTTLPSLDHGYLLIDSEIVHYGQISGSSVTGLIRGIGGTSPTAHANGATVSECNLVLRGYRMPETYSVGSSASTLTVPPMWETLLPRYIESRYKEAEQDMQAASQIRDSLEKELMGFMKSTKPLAGPQQMGAQGGAIETVVGLGSMGGGVFRL